MHRLEQLKLAVIGLGYVGLPVAAEFAKSRSVVGFDIDPQRIAALKAGQDSTLELSPQELAAATALSFTTQAEALRDCNTYIVTVPTPIDEHRRPDLRPLLAASRTVGAVLAPGDLVIYESTVYPGCTEEECVPVLAQTSGLRYNQDFFVGYSPERINPGDREHRVSAIRKITSGSTPQAAQLVDALYASIISAGTHCASSIRVAEAAKVIENTQRDVNIALVNELAVLFRKLDINTAEVLAAAATKWNFLPFKPGLVGGHCIGIDPYYLTHKAQSVGHHPEIILAGRRLNDAMGGYVAAQCIKTMIQHHRPIDGARVLVLGLSFKENCPDVRNSRVIDLIRELQEHTLQVDVYDPWVDPAQAQREHQIALLAQPATEAYDAIIHAVAHREFAQDTAAQFERWGKPGCVICDVKSSLPRELVHWAL